MDTVVVVGNALSWVWIFEVVPYKYPATVLEIKPAVVFIPVEPIKLKYPVVAILLVIVVNPDEYEIPVIFVFIVDIDVAFVVNWVWIFEDKPLK